MITNEETFMLTIDGRRGSKRQLFTQNIKRESAKIETQLFLSPFHNLQVTLDLANNSRGFSAQRYCNNWLGPKLCHGCSATLQPPRSCPTCHLSLHSLDFLPKGYERSELWSRPGNTATCRCSSLGRKVKK